MASCKFCLAPINSICTCEECVSRGKSEKIFCHVCTGMFKSVYAQGGLRERQRIWEAEQAKKRAMIAGNVPKPSGGTPPPPTNI